MPRASPLCDKKESTSSKVNVQKKMVCFVLFCFHLGQNWGKDNIRVEENLPFTHLVLEAMNWIRGGGGGPSRLPEQ